MNRFILLLLLISGNLIAQKKNGYRPDENDSLYIKAIREFIVQHNLHKDRFVVPNKDENSLYINWNNQLSDLPKNIDGYNIVLVFPGARNKIYKENNKRLVVLNITTLTFSEGKFYINIEEQETFLQSKNDTKTNQLGMWTTTYFEFVNGEMIFTKTNLSGLYRPRKKKK